MDIISLAQAIGVEFAFSTRTVHVAGFGPATHRNAASSVTDNAASAGSAPITSVSS
jgi:hypothetical protein